MLPRLNHRLIFASAIFLLLVCGSALGWMLYRIYNGEEWVRHTYNVQLLVAEIGSNLNRTGRVRQTYLDTGQNTLRLRRVSSSQISPFNTQKQGPKHATSSRKTSGGLQPVQP